MADSEKEVNIQDKYLDPANTPEIINRVKLARTLGELIDLVGEVFPDWFVTCMDSYCPDYPHLMTNFTHICQLVNTKPAQIMIVEELGEDNAHSLISTFAECFTLAGFSVRRKREYFPCGKCGSAIPNEALWHLFKDKGFRVPEKWSEKCNGCH